MMNHTILEKNIASMGPRYKVIKKALQEKKEYSESDITIGFDEIEDKKILYVVKDEKTYQLDSLYDSEPLLNIWFEQLKNINYRSRYLLFGFGNGMYAEKLLKETPETSIIIIYEPSFEIFVQVINNLDISHIFQDERIFLKIKNVGKDSVKDILNSYMTYEDLSGAVRRDYLNYQALFQKEYEIFQGAVQIVVNGIQANQGVSIRMGEAYYTNTFYNYPFLARTKSLESLYINLPLDMPVIIVSAGPSLDKNILQLKKAKGHSIIIAVDTSVRVLLKNGITPDMFVTVDGLKSVRHFEDEETKKIPLLCNLISLKEALGKHTGDKFFVNDFNSHIHQFFEEENIILPIIIGGGSVATDAFALAERLQRKKIILVGQDLAYTDNLTHSVQTIRGEKKIDISGEKVIEVEGIDGKPVKSTPPFQLYLEWFENEIANNKEVTVIDATEGGALIHGTIIKTLEQAIEEDCTEEYVDIEAAIKNTGHLLCDKQQDAFMEFMRNTPEELEELLSLINKGIRDYEKMFEIAKSNRYRSGEMQRIYRTVERVNAAIQSTPVLYYIDLRTQEAATQILDTIYDMEKDEKAEVIASVEYGLDYLKIIKDKIIETLPDITEKIADAEKRYYQ